MAKPTESKRPPPKTTSTRPLAESDAELYARAEAALSVQEYEFSGNVVTQAVKVKAIIAYAMRGIISDACRIAECGRKTWYHWVADDPQFAKATIDAKDLAMETLERVAFERGKDLSDPLLVFMLKHGKPQVFRDTIAHVGADGKNLPAPLTNVSVSPVLILPDNHRGDTPALEKPNEEPRTDAPPSGSQPG